MTGFEVYKTYLALKQHFTRKDYDYEKYRGKVRASEKSFEQRLDRYFFKKLAVKYKDHEVFDYFIANFLVDPRGYIKSFSVENYTRWKIDRESLTYKFKEDVNVLLDDLEQPYERSFEDIFKAEEGVHPPLLRRYYANEVSLDTLVIFENCLGYIDNLSKILVDPIWEDTKMKVTKYKSFLHVDCKKYKGVILDVIHTKL